MVLAVIPARYASTRFPGKPLALIQGKPMIQHVWERVQSVSGVGQVVIATDDSRIETVAHCFGATVCMTSPDHVSGTDRVWEVAQQFPGYDWILNVQGDEPFMNPASLEKLLQAIPAHPQADILTLVTPIDFKQPGTLQEEWENPNVVKAVLTHHAQVLYFSRAPIPHPREGMLPATVNGLPAFRHLGVYLFQRAALERFTQLPPSPLEQVEKLEQLRALEDGMRIDAVIVDQAPIGVDTPEDLNKVQ